MPDLNCRVAKLEEKHESLVKWLNEDKEEARQDRLSIESKVNHLISLQDKQKGFIGGITFTVTAIFSLITYYFTRS